MVFNVFNAEVGHLRHFQDLGPLKLELSEVQFHLIAFENLNLPLKIRQLEEVKGGH